jgi:hypothetical protein
LAALADRQYGFLTRAQLTASGLSAHGIHERVRTRRLLRLHRGIYAIGHRRLRREGHWLAAVLACGRGAVLSHASAATLWNLRGSAATRTDVTVPSQNGRVSRDGIRIHRSGRLGAQDVTTKDRIPEPLSNVTLCGYEVDAFSPQAKQVVELDGYAAHATRRTFQSDRQRDRRLVRAGFRPIRLTAGDLRRERHLAEELRELLRS